MNRTNDENIYTELIEYIKSEQFSCVGAKSAVYLDTIIHFDCKQVDALSLLEAYEAIVKFSQYREELSKTNSTFILSFSSLNFENGQEFEVFLWDLLGKLNEIDASSGYSWSVDCDKELLSSQFSFSLAEDAYFIVGLHPHSPRISRRSPIPALVFNAHLQFIDLKNNGVFQRMQKEIRKREIEIQGYINPMLSEFGNDSEARQYSGNYSGSDWVCPFSAKN